MAAESSEDIKIEVRAKYLDSHSDPKANHFVFAYHVLITNRGKSSAQLISRHWIIMNGRGEESEVKGPGVIGQQPRLAPGECFEYTSFCPLSTPVGSMRGSYQMVWEDGTAFHAKIPEFELMKSDAVVFQ